MRFETFWLRPSLGFEQEKSNIKRPGRLVGVGCLLLEAIKRADEKDGADSAARWRLESLDRSDEELLFFAKNGYWPESQSVPDEVNTTNEQNRNRCYKHGS